MRKLSDYKDAEAIELWMDLLDPLTEIFTDREVQAALKSEGSILSKAQTILKTHKEDASKILLTIDPTPIDGLNLITRLVGILVEFQESEVLADFFESSQPEKTESESAGSVMVSTAASMI